MRTLLLDRTTWDLCKDLNGNIAVADEPYAIAQDVASALRLFLGECWYDTSRGIPYKEQILGAFVPINTVKSLLLAGARTVPGVVSAVMYIASIANRTLIGQVQVTTKTGVLLAEVGSLPLSLSSPLSEAITPPVVIPLVPLELESGTGRWLFADGSGTNWG